jgi:hypothetical protein
MCAHAGQLTIIPSNTRVMASGSPVATMGDTYLIAGCPFNVSGAPQPCVRVQWLAPATRVLINGQPAMLQTSANLAIGATQAPQGVVQIVVNQTRALGT